MFDSRDFIVSSTATQVGSAMGKLFAVNSFKQCFWVQLPLRISGLKPPWPYQSCTTVRSATASFSTLQILEEPLYLLSCYHRLQTSVWGGGGGITFCPSPIFVLLYMCKVILSDLRYRRTAVYPNSFYPVITLLIREQMVPEQPIIR